MKFEQLLEFFRETPSYLKSNLQQLTLKTNASREDIRRASAQVRKELSSLHQAIENQGLKVSQIKSAKIYGPLDKPQVSIHTKDNWYQKSDENIIWIMKEELKKTYRSAIIPHAKISENLAVISMQDLHLDKITLKSEGGKASDIDSNIEKALGGFHKMLDVAKTNNPSQIVLIVGSDAFNANDMRNTTVRGTPQAVNYGWHEHFIKIYNFYKHCIDMSATVCNTHIMVVEGNHDADKCFYLGQMLQVAYEKDKRVTIDNSRKPRKYFRWGSTLLGFAHGDNEKRIVGDLPMIMFLENKDIMHQVNYTEWLLGDIHHTDVKQTQKAKDYRGGLVRFLRAVSELGKWENEQGYIGIPKSMDTFIYSKTEGLKANLQIHV